MDENSEKKYTVTIPHGTIQTVETQAFGAGKYEVGEHVAHVLHKRGLNVEGYTPPEGSLGAGSVHTVGELQNVEDTGTPETKPFVDDRAAQQVGVSSADGGVSAFEPQNVVDPATQRPANAPASPVQPGVTPQAGISPETPPQPAQRTPLNTFGTTKTGQLPTDIPAYDKLQAAGVTTWEALANVQDFNAIGIGDATRSEIYTFAGK